MQGSPPATRKPKGLKARIGVCQDIAKLIIVDALDESSHGGVHHESWATYVIGDDALGHTILDQVIRHVSVRAVDKAGDESATAIECRDGVELVLIQDALYQQALEKVRS